MVHFAIVATKLPKQDFKTFLLMNPQLANGGLFLHYYTKTRMLNDPNARTNVLLPDKLPLPSIITSITSITKDTSRNSNQEQQSSSSQLENNIIPKEPATDIQFLEDYEKGILKSWGHEVKIRLTYILLCKHGRQKGRVDIVLNIIETIEKSGYHLTLTYFWLQMITYHMSIEIKNGAIHSFGKITSSESESTITSTKECMPFVEFILKPHCQALRNPFLYEKYYSSSVLDSSGKQFTLPNLKQLPNAL